MSTSKRIEENVKRFYRNLDPTDTNNFYKLHGYAESIRNQSGRFSKEERDLIYSLISEETAHFILKMYKENVRDLEIIDSLVFEYDKNKTTEVDLIAISKNMVYVIECKHRSEDIKINKDGSLNTGHGIEDPIGQNIHHIRKVFDKAGYGNLVRKERILNIIYFTLNDCKVINPITLFKRKELNGAFAGYKNLIPLINKFEVDNEGGRIPYKKFAKSLRKLDLGEEGKERHIQRMKNKR